MTDPTGPSSGSDRFFYFYKKQFNIALIENLCTLREELETATYRPGGYREFYIYDAKKRKISCPETLSLIDLLIDHSNIQDSAVHYFPGGGL